MFFDWVYPTIKNIQTSDDFKIENLEGLPESMTAETCY
jgi:hypothetical protein